VNKGGRVYRANRTRGINAEGRWVGSLSSESYGLATHYNWRLKSRTKVSEGKAAVLSTKKKTFGEQSMSKGGKKEKGKKGNKEKSREDEEEGLGKSKEGTGATRPKRRARNYHFQTVAATEKKELWTNKA